MLRIHLDFEKQLVSARAAAIQTIESKSGLPLPDNHPINMIVDGVSLYEFFMQKNQQELATYAECEYGAFQEKKAVIAKEYTIEQAKQDILSKCSRDKAKGFFHLAYFGEYNYLDTLGDAITANLIAKMSIAEGAAIAGHTDVVFSILENNNQSASNLRMIEGVFHSAARGGHGALLCHLIKKYNGYEKTIIQGFIDGAFLGAESAPHYSQLISVLYFMEEQGAFIMWAMQTSSLLPTSVKDHLKLLVLPVWLDRVGFLSAKIIMKLPAEAERMKLAAFELQKFFPHDLMRIVLEYDFDFLQKDDDKNSAVPSSTVTEQKDFAALPIVERGRISRVVINQLLERTVSRNTVLNASLAALYESNKLDFLWVFIFPVWVYKNWNMTKTFFQLIQEETDTSRHEIAQQYVTQFPQHLFSVKLRQSFDAVPSTDLSQRKEYSQLMEYGNSIRK